MKDFLTRPRNWLLLTALLWVGIWYVTGLDSWAETTQGLLKLAGGVLIVAMVHFARRWLFDYLDVSGLYDVAKQHPIGAGLMFIGMAIMMLWLSLIFIASAYAAPSAYTYIPQGAYTYAPQLRIEQQKAWSAHPDPKCWRVSLSKNPVSA